MPRYPRSQKNKPQNNPVKKEDEAPKRRNSMPDLLSMGNEALQNSLAHNQTMILPLAPGNEDANKSSEDSFLVIEPEDDGYEADNEYERHQRNDSIFGCPLQTRLHTWSTDGTAEMCGLLCTFRLPRMCAAPEGPPQKAPSTRAEAGTVTAR